MERPLKFGLAGTGYWARIVHAPALAATAGIDLTAVWGGNPGAAAALAGSYGCAWFSNFDAFIAEVDAVAFADSVLVADSPFNTPWRRDNGGLWDLAPHVVSLLWASLGPVRAVTADSGAGDVTHLILHHKGGTSSTVTVSIGASEAAACLRGVFVGRGGPVSGTRTDAARRRRWAWRLPKLAANIRSGRTRHDCDVFFGHAVAGILSAAQVQIDAARAGSAASGGLPPGAST